MDLSVLEDRTIVRKGNRRLDCAQALLDERSLFTPDMQIPPLERSSSVTGSGTIS